MRKNNYTFEKFFSLSAILCFFLISLLIFEDLSIKSYSENSNINIKESVFSDYEEIETFNNSVEETDKELESNTDVYEEKSKSTTNIQNNYLDYENKIEIETTTIIQKEESTEIMTEYNSDINIIKTYSVPKGHSFKSYTNYKLLSSNSPQGRLQTQAHTDSTGIRMVGEYYCAALGTYYEGNIGDKYLVTLEGGNQFKMILCDIKSDAHTDANHQYTKVNGCVIEFYVDYSVLSSYVRSMGDISYINGFKGEIIQIQKISD